MDNESVSEKNRTADLLLAIFLGEFGIHRFYEGKIFTGILWLISAGLFGVGWVVDIIFIIVGSAKDKNGRPIKNW